VEKTINGKTVNVTDIPAIVDMEVSESFTSSLMAA